ncbi:hypothetical protein GC722_03800 [Auraticoccus sp. F435]|uniref:N-acetyltransferase domain-containing protein n=1 Tax=Auraticoccus cholistanensis TaxID=2656650 RepID=A0A6A9UQI4_9ACTN|nr:GNAT family N-acetyltransferase [Auraticoccus cholistanensis]MVA75156.1 hypothetical protein [Auraticoccus cholistanensis]
MHDAAWTIRPARPQDAEGWVECHLQALAETYPAQPAEFVASRRRQQAELVDQTRAGIAAADGRDDRWWVGLDAAGTVVGIGHSCRGAQEWERRLLASYPDHGLGLHRGVDEPGLRQLTTLYTLRRTHGSGLGGALAAELVGGEPAYLWIMTGNDRAEAFYRRLGFSRGSVAVPSGPTWFGWPMFQLVRSAGTAAA